MKYFAVLLVLLVGCSPMKKLERLERNHPYLFENVIDTVTVTVTDTVYFESVKVDTFFHKDFDTITLFKDRMKIELIQNGDTIYLDGECFGDTVYVTNEVKAPVNRFIPNTKSEKKQNLYIAILVFIALVYLIYKFKK